MTTYTIKFRRAGQWFWRKETIIGSNLDKELNRMDLFYANGTIYSITKWSEYDLKLGTDWVIAEKQAMDLKAAQSVQTNIEGIQ